MRWFGEGWGALICTEDNHCTTPVGETCQQCGKQLKEGDQGFEIPYLVDLTRDEAAVGYWHLECFLRNIGVRS